MKRENVYKILYGVSLLLAAGFCIRLGADYYRYNTEVTSAPFYVWVFERSIEFLLPGLLIFTAAKIVKRKFGQPFPLTGNTTEPINKT